MHELALLFITIGGLLLLGLAADALGRRTRIPRVTLLLALGFLIGPSVFDLLPAGDPQWHTMVANTALTIVGFLLGGRLTRDVLENDGRRVLAFSLSVVVVTACVVSAGLIAAGVPVGLALLLGAIGTSTAPAATTDVAEQSDARGPFTRALLGIVALDDAWGLIAFSVALAAVGGLAGETETAALLATGAWEIGGALMLGVALGVPMARLTGRVRPGEPTLAEALGMIMLCCGLALWLDVSFLLASMVMGTVVANLAKHHTRPFHAVHGIEWPFLVLFFLLSGSRLHLDALATAGWIGIGYITLRVAGRIGGSLLGGRIAGADPKVSRWMGPALLPQAGVALGMALVAVERFPDTTDVLIPVVIGSTVFFELIGPLATRLALVRVGEAGPDTS